MQLFIKKSAAITPGISGFRVTMLTVESRGRSDAAEKASGQCSIEACR
jgi:hypothetical protein